MGRRRRRETFPCPACGEPVEVGRVSCKACGADEATGWGDSEEETAQELDLPRPHVDDEDYDDFVRSEFGGEGPYEPRPARLSTVLFIVAGVLVFAFLLWLAVFGGRSP